MKKLLLTTLSLFIINICSAQFGIKVGLASTQVDTVLYTVKNPNDTFNIGLRDIKSTLQFGIFYRIKSGNLFVQPELIFNSNQTDYSVNSLMGTSTSVLKSEKYQYLDIPIIVGIKSGILSFQAGPVGHVFLNNKSDLIDFKNYSQNFSTITMGFQAGLGINIWKLSIDARYEGNLTRYGSHINFGNTNINFSNKPARLQLQLGFKF
jgi:hypothetical protein